MNETKGFDIQDGVLVRYRGRQKNVVIPDCVKEIGQGAFSGHSNLESVLLPDGIKKIGYEAFSKCSSLTSINIPESVKCIESYAFSGCSSLKTLECHNRIKFSGHVFEGCAGLVDPAGFLIVGGILWRYLGSESEITIPKGIRRIEEGAFHGCSTLKNVVLPVGITEIGESAFSECGALTEMTLPESLTKIGNGTFSGCIKLKNLGIPEGVKSVGEWAFRGCNSLTSVVIPNSVKKLGCGAFEDCSNLANIVLSERISTIAVYTFKNCARLKNLTLPQGVGAVEESAFSGCKSLTEMEIPEGVTKIGKEAFKACAQLRKVIIPGSVHTIEYDAFTYCGALREVCIKDLEAWCRIRFDNAESNPMFCSCSLLLNGEPVTKLQFPETLQRVQPYSFVHCKDLGSITIPATVKIIDTEAFSGCIKLKNVSLSCGITEFGRCSFAGCTSLEELTIPESVIKIGNGAFRDCAALTELEIPAGVKRIEPRASSNCRSLNRIVVPDENQCYCSDQRGVLFNKAGNQLLAAPGALSGSYAIPFGVRRIEDYAFFGCDRMTVLEIPNSVVEIGMNAFEGCSGLKELRVPDSVKDLGWHALYGVQEIRVREWTDRFTNAVCEDAITAIHTDDLQKVPSELKKTAICGFLKDKDIDRKSVCYKSHRAYLTKNVEKLSSYFLDAPELLYELCEKQLLPAKSVDAYMAETEKRQNTEIKALLLNYQQVIGNEKMAEARAAKEKIKQDYADGLVDRLAKRDPSRGIEGLTFVVTGSLRHWGSRDEIREWLEQYGASLGNSVTMKTDYLVTDNTESGTEKNRKAGEVGALVISGEEFNHMVGRHYKDEETIIVPAWLREIPAWAFQGNRSTKSVEIPDSITKIGFMAFAGCENLKNIRIPKSVHRIENYVFRGCRALADEDGAVIFRGVLYDYFGNEKEAKIPGRVIRIEAGAFYGRAELERVVIADGVKYIGCEAFRNCTGLRQITIPDTVQRIGCNAFSDCSGLKTIVIPGSVRKIEKGTFSGCKSLETVVVSEGVECIGVEAFSGCTGLKTVDLPDSLTAFGKNALPSNHNFTVRASKNSHAMQYAKRRKLTTEVKE